MKALIIAGSVVLLIGLLLLLLRLKTAITLILLIIGGYIIYTYFYTAKKPQETESLTAKMPKGRNKIPTNTEVQQVLEQTRKCRG